MFRMSPMLKQLMLSPINATFSKRFSVPLEVNRAFQKRFPATTFTTAIKFPNIFLRRCGTSSNNNYRAESKHDNPLENGNHPYWGATLGLMGIGILAGGMIGGAALSDNSDNKIEKAIDYIGGFCIGGFMLGGVVWGVSMIGAPAYTIGREVARGVSKLGTRHCIFTNVAKNNNSAQPVIPEIQFVPKNERLGNKR